jgi:hypothetical protein
MEVFAFVVALGIIVVVLLAIPVIALLAGIAVMVAVLLVTATGIGIAGSVVPAALLAALKGEEEHEMLGRFQSYWRDTGEVARAQALVGGWCLAQCEGARAYAVGGLLSSICRCAGSPREIPQVSADRRALAQDFIRWAQQQRSRELRQLGRLAQEVLAAYDAQDQRRFDSAESRFWSHWVNLPRTDWEAVFEWRQAHVPERLRRPVFREILEKTATELEQILESAP